MAAGDPRDRGLLSPVYPKCLHRHPTEERVLPLKVSLQVNNLTYYVLIFSVSFSIRTRATQSTSSHSYPHGN